jgi:Mn-containing catalase
VFNGPHPETGEDLVIADQIHPDGALANDLPPQTAVFAPGPDPEMIAEVAARLRNEAGLSSKPTGVVANGKPATSSSKPKAKAKVASR